MNNIIQLLGDNLHLEKTDTLTSIQDDLEKRNIFLIAIDADSLRSYHPDYRKLNNIDDKTAAIHTGADIGKWTEKVIDYATTL